MYLKGRLARLLALNLEAGEAERCDIVQELAARLSQVMAASGAAATPGALFAIQARIEGTRRVALVKLDLGRQELVALRRSAEASLYSKVIEDVLPEQAKVLKAVLFPSPGEGDARSCQFDAFSDYWQTFVGAQPQRESVKATQAILKAASEVMQQEGKVLSEGLGGIILERVAALKNRGPNQVAGVIKEVTRVEKKLAKIEEALLRHLGNAALDGVAKVSAYRYRFLDDEVKLKVPAHLVREGKIHIRSIDGDAVIRIRGTDIDRDDIIEP